MSIYSTKTKSNINKSILNDDLNYQKLQKFNKFYLTNTNFSCKDKNKIASSNNVDNIFSMEIPLTPRTTLAKTNINNIRSRNSNNQKTLTKYKTFNNYDKMKKNLIQIYWMDNIYLNQRKQRKSIVD